MAADDSTGGALGAVDAATRLGVRRHPVVAAAILSDFVVRAIDIAATIDRGRRGNLDRAFIRTRAGGLSRDMGRSREWAQARHVRLGVTATSESVLRLTLDRANERCLPFSLTGYFRVALNLAVEFSHAIDVSLARRLDLRLSLSRDEDLELACELIDGLDSHLEHALALTEEVVITRERVHNVSRARDRILDLDRVIRRALDLALERSRALDRVCAQGVAGRPGIAQTHGLAGALLEGGLDDFTTADLTWASLAVADLTGVRWSLSGTRWPPETDVKALLARSEEIETGVLVVKRRGMA